MSLASRSFSLAVVESLTSAVVVLFAILGNAVLLFALCRKPRTKNSTLVMVGSLALVDFLFTSTTAPLFVLSLAAGRLASNDLGCQLNGFYLYTVTRVSILIMTLTAISRYYCVLKADLYRHLFAFRRTICYNFVVWIFAISEVLVVLFFGRARIVFNPYSVRHLHPDFSKSKLNSRLHSLCGLLLRRVLSLHHLFLLQSSDSVHSPTQRQHCFRDDSRNQSDPSPVCTDIFICHSMGTILYHRMILPESHFPREMGFASTLLNHLSSAINPWPGIWRNESSCP